MLLSIMFCLISSVSWAMLHSNDTTLWTDFVENPSDGLVYKKFQATPFTGVVMATPDDPVQRSYEDGVKHGEWVEFDANGLVKTKSEFSDGQLQKKVGFEDGKETTEERYRYYENGQLSSKSNYKDGELHWLQEGYRENGQLSYKHNFKDKKKHGLQEDYHENGYLEFKRSYKSGYKHGLWKRYYKTGQLQYEENYQDGKKHGLQEFFKKHGSLLFSSKYENGMKVSD